jgi:hypothetical protein
VTIELKTYEATAAEVFDLTYWSCEHSIEVKDFIDTLMPDTDNTFSTRHFCGDPFAEIIEELFI